MDLKQPNKPGVDLFRFVIKENGLFPAGCDVPNKCSSEFRGDACTCKVLTEGKIDY